MFREDIDWSFNFPSGEHLIEWLFLENDIFINIIHARKMRFLKVKPHDLNFLVKIKYCVLLAYLKYFLIFAYILPITRRVFLPWVNLMKSLMKLIYCEVLIALNVITMFVMYKTLWNKHLRQLFHSLNFYKTKSFWKNC